MHAYYRLRAPGALVVLDSLAKTQGLPQEHLQELQNKRLCALLQHAFAYVPYYRDLLAELRAGPGDFQSVDDLRQLPSLTREQLRLHADRLLDERVNTSQLLRNSTGGSTGTPVTFYQNRAYWRVCFASMWRAWFLFPGYDLGVRHLRFWGADRDEPHRMLRVVGRYFFNQSFLNSFCVTSATLNQACEQIRRLAPRLLIAYASSAELLAHHVRQTGQRLRIPSIVSSAETLATHQRELLKETFDAQVHNCYGCREVGAIAQECEASQGLHVNVETQVVEFEPVNPAIPGGPYRVLITHLCNTAMPLIRYDLGDTVLAGALNWDRCPCGRSLPRMSPVVGRVSDIIRSPRGTLVHGEYFTHLFYNQDAVKAFQVHQIDLERLVIRIVPGDNYQDQFVEQVIQWITADHSFSDIKVEMCNEIQREPSGKIRFTRSDIDPRGECYV
jgi:phenylacetate-CoA ligase